MFTIPRRPARSCALAGLLSLCGCIDRECVAHDCECAVDEDCVISHCGIPPEEVAHCPDEPQFYCDGTNGWPVPVDQVATVEMAWLAACGEVSCSLFCDASFVEPMQGYRAVCHQGRCAAVDLPPTR